MLLILLMPMPVFAADLAEPSSVSLYSIEIFNGLLKAGDFTAIVPYNIPFATQPSININSTFIFSILSADGTTQLGSVLAYPRYNGGYGKGIVSFYIESGMVWETSYIFRVQENPVYYSAPKSWDFSIGTAEYSPDTDQSEGLRAKILDIGSELSLEWSVDLLTSGDSSQTVLSTYGELYFLNAVPGLQNMCPTLFSIQIQSPDYTKRSWSYSLSNALRTKYAGTFVDDFMTGYAGLFNMDKNNAMDVLSIIIFAMVIALAVWKFKASMLSAFIDGYDVLLLLMLMGAFSMIIAGIFAFFSVLLGGVILLLNK